MRRMGRFSGPFLWLCMIILGLTVGSARAADRDPSETQSWFEFSMKAKIARGTSATFTQNLRWEDMFGELILFAPEISMRQKLQSWWRIEGGYRYKRKQDNDGIFQHRHRIFANTRFRTRSSWSTVELRLQWQEEFRHELDDGSPRRQFLRTRAKIKIRGLPSVTPYASVELYNRLDGGDDDVAAGTMTKLRAALGVAWGRGALQYNAGYLLIVPLHDDQDPLQHVLSLGMDFDLPR